MASTLSIPFNVLAEVEEIEGGGYRARVPRLPGCVTEADTLEELREALAQAVEDWLFGEPVKTEEEAWGLARIQGFDAPLDPGPYPQPNPYMPPPGWDEDDD